MTPAETAAQLRLAADILETGHPFEWRNVGLPDWHPSNGNSVHHFMNNCVIRPILARPSYEAELHNPDGLTADQVGVGYRLLLPEESKILILWETLQMFANGKWLNVFYSNGGKSVTYRLPLSVPWPEQPDPYAELKKAHAEGKVIQSFNHERNIWQDCPSPAFEGGTEYRIKPDDSPPWIEWHGGECPLKDEEVKEWEYRLRDGSLIPSHLDVKPSGLSWRHYKYGTDIIAYRVLKWREKKPKFPLGPDDVPPGSIFIVPTRRPSTWHAVAGVYEDCVQMDHGDVPFDELMEDGWQINRSIPLTGKWDPEAWENCEK